MTSKTDQILNHLIDVKEDVAGIKEHLRSLNGKVEKQEQRICNLEIDSTTNKVKWAKTIGVGGISGSVTSAMVILIGKIFGVY